MAVTASKLRKRTTRKTKLKTPSQRKSKVGAPSQYAQPSRKGKKAWRKNVDLDEVEDGLEEVRAEVREVGSALHKKPDEELFHIDDKGDDKIRPHLPKFDRSSLSYVRGLAQRSAVPAVFSRVNTTTTATAASSSSSSSKQPIKLSKEDKARLLRIARRPTAGPFNSIVLPAKNDVASLSAAADSHAVKESGKYNIWTADTTTTNNNTSTNHQPKNILRESIAIPAVCAPPSGASYNPPADAHAALLQEACERAAREEAERLRREETKQKLENVVRTHHGGVQLVAGMESGAPGMVVDGTGEDEDAEEEGKEGRQEDECNVVAEAKKIPMRKTKQQRRKKERLLAEKRALAERLAYKRLLAKTSLARGIASQTDSMLRQRAREREERRAALMARLRSSGLAGKKFGKHVVAEGKLDVQLGEDLSESLRGLKVEGNLFRDRFLSMQHRALIEPRARVLPKKHRRKTKEVEKYAWRFFDMKQEFPL